MLEEEVKAMIIRELDMALERWRASPEAEIRMQDGRLMTLEEWVDAIGQHAPKDGAIFSLLNWWY